MPWEYRVSNLELAEVRLGDKEERRNAVVDT